MSRPTPTASLLVALVAAPLLPGSPLHAQAAEAPEDPLTITATRITSSGAAKRVDGQLVLLPGDRVRYDITFTNTTGQAATGIQFEDPIPAGLTYVAESAIASRPDVVVTYSIDGGKTFSPEPTVERVVDGEPVQVPAPAEAYSHIRWTLPGAVAPGAQVTASFRARLAGDTSDTPADGGS